MMKLSQEQIDRAHQIRENMTNGDRSVDTDEIVTLARLCSQPFRASAWLLGSSGFASEPLQVPKEFKQ